MDRLPDTDSISVAELAVALALYDDVKGFVRRETDGMKAKEKAKFDTKPSWRYGR